MHQKDGSWESLKILTRVFFIAWGALALEKSLGQKKYQSCAAALLPPAGPPEVIAEVPCGRHRAVVTCASGGAPGAKQRPTTRAHRRYIATRFTLLCR
jgi:hypothetical protein